MTLQLRQETLEIPFGDPFRIARPSDAARAVTVIVDLVDDADGAVGLGEGFPDRYYGETPETIGVVLPILLEAVQPLAEGLRGDLATVRGTLVSAATAMNEAISHHTAAKCALDIALHDLAARRLEIPLYELLGLSPDIPPTDFTLGIDEPEVVAQRARKSTRFPALKVKLGGAADIETLRAVRRFYSGPIRVDANTGWTLGDAIFLAPALQEMGVELIEQPFPAHQLKELAALQDQTGLPVVADESAVTIEDLDALVGVVRGINVKLAKAGGVGPAMRMLLRARELGFRTFLGCMEETRVGIAASAAVASLATWVDLDGPLLLAEDPFEGLELGRDCRWQLTDRPGLGVSRKAS